jgi:hypothetical protein
MQFKTFLNAFMRVPCQIVRTGRRIVYRLLAWNRWQHVFLRAVDALRGPMTAIENKNLSEVTRTPSPVRSGGSAQRRHPAAERRKGHQCSLVLELIARVFTGWKPVPHDRVGLFRRPIRG